MKFEDVLHNGRLWAVRYDGDSQNILNKTFGQWLDIGYLQSFFDSNRNDLKDFFHITNLDDAIYDTIVLEKCSYRGKRQKGKDCQVTIRI